MSGSQPAADRLLLTGERHDEGSAVLLGVLDRHLLKLGHRTFNIELRATRPRVSAREQRSLPVLEEVEVEGLAETKTEDLQIGVGLRSVTTRHNRTYLRKPMLPPHEPNA